MAASARRTFCNALSCRSQGCIDCGICHRGAALFGWLNAGRICQFGHMRSAFGFAWPADKALALEWSSLAMARSSIVESLIQRRVPWILLHHGAISLFEKAGAQWAFSSPMDTGGGAVVTPQRSKPCSVPKSKTTAR